MSNQFSFQFLTNFTWIYYDLWIDESQTFSPTLYVFSFLQIVYALHFLVTEFAFVTTFEYIYEGIGFYSCLGYHLYPFIPSTITKHILDRNIVYPNYILAVSLILFILGYYIVYASNWEKDTFRRNPADPKIACKYEKQMFHQIYNFSLYLPSSTTRNFDLSWLKVYDFHYFSDLQTIPTSQGKKLIVSGWWGFVRHPNYLGDLMLHTAWGIGAYNSIPLLVIVFTYFILIHRIIRDGMRCRERYGVAWKRYSQMVPYAIVPYVF
jgi:steroid 5-alpha reductase family enzyme